ncbi:MAG TPA: ATP-binding protein, partial [bacterium]|nr:ATP-binding protein [bacterium]
LRISIFSLYFFILHALYAQNEEGLIPTQYYSTSQFFAHNQNWAVTQDQQTGLIYAGNNVGILEFDGATWRIIHTANRTMVRSLAYDPVGHRVLVGAQGEFGYLKPDSVGIMRYESLSAVLPEEARRFVNVWRIWVTNRGTFFQTNTEVFILQNETLRIIKPDQSSFHFSFLANGNVYVTLRNVGLQKFNGDKFETVPGGDRFHKIPIYAVLSYAPDTVLIATQEGLFLGLNNGVIPFGETSKPFLKTNRVYNGLNLPDGRFALATLTGGVAILNRNGTIARVLDKSNGLGDNAAKSIFLDRDKALWVSLEKGICRIEYFSPFTYFDDRVGLLSQFETFVRWKGKFYIGTKDALYVLDRQPSSHIPYHFKTLYDVPEEHWSLLPMGDVMLDATFRNGIYEISSHGRKRISPNSTAFLLRSRLDTHRVYAALWDGLSSVYLRNGIWVDEGRYAGITDEVRVIAEDSDGSLWMDQKTGGCARMSRINDSIYVRRFSVKDGLPNLTINPYFFFGRMWFATDNGALYRYDEKASRFYPDTTLHHRLGIATSKMISPIGETSDGTLWFALGNDESMRFEPAYAVPDGDKYRVTILAHGRLKIKLSPGNFFVEENAVWFYGHDNFYRVDRLRANGLSHDFKVNIRKFTLNDSLLYGGALHSDLPTIVVPFGTSVIRIDYAATAFENQNDIHFKFKLDGFDEEWSARTTEAFKEYTHLPEGKYTFRVKGYNVYEFESSEASIDFIVLPPWYRTWWSFVLYFFVGAGIVYAGFRWRVRLLRLRNKELFVKVEERTRELASANHEIETQRDFLKNMNQQLESALKDLRETQTQLIQTEKMATVGQMVAGVMHEINNPLTFILPNIEYIEKSWKKLVTYTERSKPHVAGAQDPELLAIIQDIERGLLIDETFGALDSMRRGSQRIKQVVVNLRAFAAMDYLPKSETVVDAHIEQTVDLFFGTVKDLSFVKKLSYPTPIKVRIQEFNQSVVALLNNAVQAIRDAEMQGTLERGKGVIEIRTQSHKGDANTLEFSISDNGIGIPEDILPRIFEPFFTTRSVGQGRGLGLSEVYAVVHKHNGLITTQSKVGH